jgi:hypothetical protein
MLIGKERSQLNLTLLQDVGNILGTCCNKSDSIDVIYSKYHQVNAQATPAI